MVVIIPLALLSTFLGLKIMGVPANLLSPGAMDFGIIVDGAVIVIENILARLSQQPETLSNDERAGDRRCGQRGRAANPVFDADHHCSAHPDLCLAAPRRPHFQPMALSVTTALVGSLIFSLTLVPLLAYWTLRKKCRIMTTGLLA